MLDLSWVFWDKRCKIFHTSKCTFIASSINCPSPPLSPRMPLWSCMTGRGTRSSIAPGPPSRRSSAWLHSGLPASPSEHTLHRSERAVFFLLPFISHPHVIVSPHPPSPQRCADPFEITFTLLCIWLSSKPSLRKTPCSLTLHVKTQTNHQNNGSKRTNSPRSARAAEM